jgi:tRNA pseudouridine38-40 synthase
MRVALDIAYNGKEYFGSQIQKTTDKTVLGTLHNVLVKLGIESSIVASGRTDKGVHASSQICHIDLPHYWSDTTKLKRVINEMLPPSIHLKRVLPVRDEFHARYSAKKRTYRYLIKTKESNPFQSDFITFLPACDFGYLQKNITLFVGEHNFKYFIKTGSDEKSTVRTIYKAFAYQYKDMIVLHFEANGFLRSQVRLMVGALLTLNTQQIQEKLACRYNHKTKPAPPNGLYLAKIKY